MHTKLEHGRVDVRSTVLIDGVGAAGENDTLGLVVKIGNLGGAWQHLRENVELSHTTGDSLGVIGLVCLLLSTFGGLRGVLRG